MFCNILLTFLAHLWSFFLLFFKIPCPIVFLFMSSYFLILVEDPSLSRADFVALASEGPGTLDQVKNLLLRGNDPDSTGQSASQSVSQSISRSVSQSISQSVNQSVGRSVSQLVSQSVSQSVGEHCHLVIIELLNIVESIFIFIFYDIFFLLYILLFAVFLSTDEKEFFFSLCFHLYEIFYFFSKSCDCKFNGGLVVEYRITLLDRCIAFILHNSYSLLPTPFPLLPSLYFFLPCYFSNI